jgi:hypothetical protein
MGGRMSSALAIASMTYVLKSLLDNRLIQSAVTASVGEVTVTALPPDRIAIGDDERSQINLFLYRVTPHITWRGGQSPLDARSPALTLDLYYLVTAYGARDFEAEILLGHAMQLFLATPVLTGVAIHDALVADVAGSGGAGLSHARFAPSVFADQTAEITLSPEFLGAEEASRLWSALQAKYRPSVAYKVSAVTIKVEG